MKFIFDSQEGQIFLSAIAPTLVLGSIQPLIQ